MYAERGWLREWAIPYETNASPSLVSIAPITPAVQAFNNAITTSSERVVPLRRHQEHTKARFRMLRRLQDNHDGEGALAAVSISVDTAISFVDRHSFGEPVLATLDDDGLAVIEVHGNDATLFASITFHTDGEIECYLKKDGEQSFLLKGPQSTNEMLGLLEKAGVR